MAQGKVNCHELLAFEKMPATISDMAIVGEPFNVDACANILAQFMTM